MLMVLPSLDGIVLYNLTLPLNNPAMSICKSQVGQVLKYDGQNGPRKNDTGGGGFNNFCR